MLYLIYRHDLTGSTNQEHLDTVALTEPDAVAYIAAMQQPTYYEYRYTEMTAVNGRDMLMADLLTRAQQYFTEIAEGDGVATKWLRDYNWWLT